MTKDKPTSTTVLLLAPLLLLLLHPVLANLDSSSCAFPNGQQATGYAVCNPTAAQSSCCLEGEACLQDGLCYGAIGFMYRGACAGGWGNSTACPDYCSTVAGLDGSWANLLPCYSNDSVVSYNPDWWCGLDTACNLDVANAEPTRNSIFTLPFTGKAATAILGNGTTSPGCGLSSDVSATASGSVTMTTVTATATVTPSSASSGDGLCPAHGTTVSTGAIAGLAVLGVVTLLSIGWAVWENRARRRQGRALKGDGYGQTYNGQASQFSHGARPGGGGSGGYQERSEMEARRTMPVEMDSRKTMVAEM